MPRLTSKGQITIPKRVRDALGLRKGMRIEFVVKDGWAILEPVRESGADALAGSLKSYGARQHRGSEGRLLEGARRKVARDARREGLSPRH